MPKVKPMLAFSKLPDFNLLKFPLLVSPKLDGIRCSMQEGRLHSRSLKFIPNVNVQAKFASVPDGVDGELIVGSPTDDPYRKTTSVVMSDDKPAPDVRWYVFDYFIAPNLPFGVRFKALQDMLHERTDITDVIVVPHVLVFNADEMEKAEQAFLGAGYEGAIIRSVTGPYKQGRSTESEGYLLKLKRFEDAEARVTGLYEEMENQNVATVNELGRTHRSSHKAGKVGKNTLGGFHVVGVGGRYDGVEFDVAVSSLTHVQRKKFWGEGDKLHDLTLVYKYFPTGGDTRPRHPIFKGWRDERDI